MPGLVSAGHLSPVHDVPENVDVLQAAVPVLEVVDVLPQVQPQYGRLVLHERRVLVSHRLDRERSVCDYEQPRPARAEQGPGAAAAVNCSLRLSSDPKPQVMSSARSSSRFSSPPTPEFGASICQNIEWLACPPPLLRTAVRISSGTESSSAIRTSTLPGSASGCFFSVALRLAT